MMKLIRKSWGGDPLLDRLEETKIHIPERAHSTNATNGPHGTHAHGAHHGGLTTKTNEHPPATIDVDFLDQRHKVHSANTTPMKTRKSSNLVDFDDYTHPPPPVTTKPKTDVTANLIEF
eukprot:TRINITY_DN10553_c0_g1_i4.p1 TRINITY_DN10553_c0_g1~~TRINITY_DN10553_c0_g1_i4.p1  ORF type:complete len:119 (-),score=27.63 TRINITY_DN10553_c0_g1_i4:180-536(-)